MKRFKFRLQTVLEYRERTRDDRKGELIAANQRVSEAEDELERLISLESQNSYNNQAVTTSDALQLQGHLAEALRFKITLQQQKKEELKEVAATALEAYQEATKEVRAVEILKERKLQEYHEKVQKLESEDLDELSIQRAGKRDNV